MNFLQGSQNARVDQLVAYQVEGDLHVGVSAEWQKSTCELLQPIEDASHARDRTRSPPDSACARGTRLEVVHKVRGWAGRCILVEGEPHIYWMHGYVGCGKSAISQEVCRKTETEGRPLASFFFFRNAGDRSRIWRLAPTLAGQMAASVPETAPFVRAAAIATPGLKNFPVPITSVAMQMQRLIYGPLKAATDRGPIRSLENRPFLIVIDGLDECEDKDKVEELIDSMLTFFDDNPFIPLRIFITSRVEQHIQSRLEVPGVRLDNLVNHCADDDILAFLDVLFRDAGRQNPVIKAYVQRRGEWPTSREKRKLVQHIGGSFIFASAIFKFIMGYNTSKQDPSTPMDRLPLALKMNPGLDGLYVDTLARSEHFPHFFNIISTIALLRAPLPTSGIAEILGIDTYEVVNVLVDLQAIFQVPGTDDTPVTLCHTSLRDFLTNQSRSGRFFAHPRHHVRLYLRSLELEHMLRSQRPGRTIRTRETTPAIAYYRRFSINHLEDGQDFLEKSESESAIELCRKTLDLDPGSPELVDALADVISRRGVAYRREVEEAISLYRQGLQLRPLDEGRWMSLYRIADTLIFYFEFTEHKGPLEEAIDLYREALILQPFPNPDSWVIRLNLSEALKCRYKCTGVMADLEEAISLGCEALELRPSPHPDRSISLHNLAASLRDRYLCRKSMADLEEVISLQREALELRPYPHPDRSTSLQWLAVSLGYRYRSRKSLADLKEAISLQREVLKLRPSPHSGRSISLHNLAASLLDCYQCSKSMADLEEAISLQRQALELQPSPHSGRSDSLHNLAFFLRDRYYSRKSMADLEEASFLYRQALELRPRPHPDRPDSLWGLSKSLQMMFQATDTLSYLQEAIAHGEELLQRHYPAEHEYRVKALNHLASSLEMLCNATKKWEQGDLDRIQALREEASGLSVSTSDT